VKIRVVEGDPLALPSEALIVSLFEDDQRPTGALKAVDAALGGALSTLIEQGEIKGKLGEAHVLHTLGRIAPQRVIVCGLGKQPDFTLDRARIVAANAARALRKLNVERASTVLHGTDAGVDAPLAARALAEGTLLGLYTFDKYRKEPEARKELRELSIVGAEAESPAHLEQAVGVGEVCADAASFCRDLVNEPANNMTPSALAERARDFAQELGLEIQVLERDDMERLAMGGLLAVSKGSSQPAKLIVLSYHGDADSEARLGFVGKGITFDSGGLSIKPSEHLDEMKGDMAGAAAVLCAVQAIARLKPKVNVTGLMPATENMPDGGAYRPGDILKALSGKTIEITSTDAEGRLILADALAYARQLGLAQRRLHQRPAAHGQGCRRRSGRGGAHLAASHVRGVQGAEQERQR